jgi:hypothetical protein
MNAASCAKVVSTPLSSTAKQANKVRSHATLKSSHLRCERFANNWKSLHHANADTTMTTARSVAIIFVLLSLLVPTAWYGLHFVPADFSYSVATEFDEVPPSDAALEKWLQGQPGVFRAWVERQSVAPRSGVVVTVGMTHNSWGDPPFPDLAGKCAELGYRGQQGPFRDQPR